MHGMLAQAPFPSVGSAQILALSLGVKKTASLDTVATTLSASSEQPISPLACAAEGIGVPSAAVFSQPAEQNRSATSPCKLCMSSKHARTTA